MFCEIGCNRHVLYFCEQEQKKKITSSNTTFLCYIAANIYKPSAGEHLRGLRASLGPTQINQRAVACSGCGQLNPFLRPMWLPADGSITFRHSNTHKANAFAAHAGGK